MKDASSLGDHVRKIHQMSIHDYRSKYRTEEEAVAGSPPTPSSTPPGLPEAVLQNPFIRYDVITNSVRDLCMCKCRACGKELLHTLTGHPVVRMLDGIPVQLELMSDKI